MATPLADLLRTVLTDDSARLAAGRTPSAFLHEHGWEHLDAADLREAMLVLADGAPTVEATVWVTGSDAIDGDGDVGDALATAIATFGSDLVDLVDLDDLGTPDDDAIEDDEDDGDPDTGDPQPMHDADETDIRTTPSDVDPFEAIELDEPDHFAGLDHARPGDDPGPGEFGDGWDDLI
jgi:hypothetical protein